MPEQTPTLDDVFEMLVDMDEDYTCECPTSNAVYEVECMYCAVLDCPHAEPFHYHHDGCPACYNGFNDNPKLERRA